MSIRSDTVSV